MLHRFTLLLYINKNSEAWAICETTKTLVMTVWRNEPVSLAIQYGEDYFSHSNSNHKHLHYS